MSDYPRVVFQGAARSKQMTIPEFAEKMGLAPQDIVTGWSNPFSKKFAVMSIDENEGIEPATFTHRTEIKVGNFIDDECSLRVRKGVLFGVAGSLDDLKPSLEISGRLYPTAIGMGYHPAFVVQIDRITKDKQSFNASDAQIDLDAILNSLSDVDRLPLEPQEAFGALSNVGWDTPIAVERTMTFLNGHEGLEYDAKALLV